jgi:hypothetical protein
VIEVMVGVDHVLDRLFGARVFTSAMTAAERASSCGPSITTKLSLISTSALWWVPPVRYQTPSATLSACTLMLAWRTLSGGWMLAGALALTSLIGWHLENLGWIQIDRVC